MSTLSPHSFIHSTHFLHLIGSLRKEQEEGEKEGELMTNRDLEILGILQLLKVYRRLHISTPLVQFERRNNRRRA